MTRPVPVSFELAFSDLYWQEYRVSFRILGDRLEAEDIAQNALARAILRWDKLHEQPEGVASNLASTGSVVGAQLRLQPGNPLWRCCLTAVLITSVL